jgi:uncharacterized protein YndB with AHSA1/START domain
MSTVEGATLRLERVFDATPEEVFDAWTSPEVLRRWWRVDPAWRTPEVEVDARAGGAYRLSMEDPEAGRAFTVVGEYREVRRPELLVYSWAWQEPDGQIGPASTVTVEFARDPAGGGTRVLLTHAGLPDAESRERHGHGWEGCLDSLRREIFS